LGVAAQHGEGLVADDVDVDVVAFLEDARGLADEFAGIDGLGEGLLVAGRREGDRGVPGQDLGDGLVVGIEGVDPGTTGRGRRRCDG
jgi:hypothetical protein